MVEYAKDEESCPSALNATSKIHPEAYQYSCPVLAIGEIGLQQSLKPFKCFLMYITVHANMKPVC